MPIRKTLLANDYYYHIFNRGVAHGQIFNDKRDYKRFIKTMFYYQIQGPKPRFSLFTPETMHLDQNKKIVEIICYCLMPNHFHFLLQQKKDGGISEFISKLSNSFTKYFNIKNKRVGPLLQGAFQAVRTETDEQLLHLSRYIHLNPLVSYLTKSLDDYPWSSYSEYSGKSKDNFFLKDIVLGLFKSENDYIEFIKNQEDYGKKLEIIKHTLIDYPKV